jgi:peptidoglycan/LPS O-acetylase OafA/YrhL
MVRNPEIPTRPPAPSSFEPRALSLSASAHLDFVRAIAAWAVMWGHLRAFFFVDFSSLPHASLTLDGIYLITGFGHQAVMVFFVLSGFLISTSVIKKYAAGAWSFRDYAIDRASRLYIVLIPGLLLGLMWDESGRSFFAFSGLYSRPLVAFGTIIVQDQINLKNFLGNLLFLQTILCQTFGSNGPLWSLANEFWYYVLFPLVLIAALAWRRSSLRVAIPFTVLAFCIAAFVGSNILFGFLIWLAGSGLVLAYRQFQLRRKAVLIPYLLICFFGLSICLLAARTARLGILGSDCLVGLAFTFFLFGVLQIDLGPGHEYYARITHFFSDFSYSLYVLHFPFILFLRARITPYYRWQPDPIHLLYGVLIGSLAIGYAWITAVFTENKTRLVRSWMRSVIGRFDSWSCKPQSQPPLPLSKK